MGTSLELTSHGSDIDAPLQVTDFIGSENAGDYCKDKVHARFWAFFACFTLVVHVLLSLYIMLTLLIILQRQGSGVLRHIDLATADGAASLQEQLTARPQSGELTTSMFLQQLRLAKQIIEVPTRPFTAGHCLQLCWQAAGLLSRVCGEDDHTILKCGHTSSKPADNSRRDSGSKCDGWYVPLPEADS